MNLGENLQSGGEDYGADIIRLQEQIVDLYARIQSTPITPPVLQYPLDTQSQNSISQSMDTLLPEKVMSAEWKKLFHYFTNFDYIGTGTAFSITTTGTGSVLAGTGEIVISTGATVSSQAEIARSFQRQGLVTYSQPSFMRTALHIDTNTNQTIYLLAGNQAVANYYGFKVVGGTLYGVSKDGTTESTVPLLTLSTSPLYYNIEARYYPRTRVDFFVDDPTTTPATKISLKASKANNLPSPTLGNNVNLMDFSIINTEGVSKSMRVSFYEYIQSRNILKY